MKHRFLCFPRGSTFCGVVAFLVGPAVMPLLAAENETADFRAPIADRQSAAKQEQALAHFHRVVRPILEENCFECHGNGVRKARLAFDELTTSEEILHNPDLWLKVLKNTRSHIMPPPDNPPLSAEQQRHLEQWIKTDAFALDPNQPDPGRVTIRRLNRTEYRNAIRDLLGIDFNTDVNLPPDDIGYGFDNIGDVLNISPLRMEKFIEAAMAAVEQGAPMDTVTISQQLALPKEFLSADGAKTGDHLTFYQVNKVTRRFHARVAGEYRIHIAAKVDGDATPDPQRVRIHVYSDDQEFFQQEYKWSDAEYYDDTRVVYWEAGDHEVSFVTEPLLDLQPLRSKMEYRVLYVQVDGPLDRKHWVHPPRYERFYSRAAPPTERAPRRAYAREVLAPFARQAFRRPVPRQTVERLVDLAESNYSLPGIPFEKGIAQAMVAVLASPEFLFHRESSGPIARGARFAPVDEYTLASRLSFTLWASIPDAELTRLAERGQLRKNFRAQVQRMLADPKSEAFAENFAGQWLQSRGVLDVQINSAEIMAREGPPRAPAAVAETAGSTPGVAVASTPPAAAPPAEPVRRNRRAAPPPGTVLTPEIRGAMKREVESYFSHIVRGDRSVLELLDSDYTFVNEQLAPVYGIAGVTGNEMRQVMLPPGDLRGGVLTMGSVLMVTSNPTRTSPVKRGKWILENILGAPSAPPPPDIPALEDAQSKDGAPAATQRELLALHRADPLCSSCHSRMDPLGLALEEFNAFGRFRTQDMGKPIDASGALATGEKFAGVRDLKRVLVENHRAEFYRTLTEKLMIYALGRGLEYYDVPTVDSIAERLESENGRFSALLLGVLESAAFQQRRATANSPTANASTASLTTPTLSPR